MIDVSVTQIKLTNDEELFIFLKSYMMKFNDNEEEVERRIYHSIRVSMLCEMIATLEGMTREQINELSIAGRMHDICKFEKDKFHAMLGAIKTREICLDLGYEENTADNICSIIMKHSDKSYYNKYLTKSQQILIEADIIEHLFKLNFKQDDKDNIEKVKKVLSKQKKLGKLIKTKAGKTAYKLSLNKLKSYYKRINKGLK